MESLLQRYLHLLETFGGLFFVASFGQDSQDVDRIYKIILFISYKSCKSCETDSYLTRFCTLMVHFTLPACGSVPSAKLRPRGTSDKVCTSPPGRVKSPVAVALSVLNTRSSTLSQSISFVLCATLICGNTA